jgi:hypothetical protein
MTMRGGHETRQGKTTFPPEEGAACGIVASDPQRRCPVYGGAMLCVGGRA